MGLKQISFKRFKILKIKISFLEEISKEINTAIQINYLIFLAIDVFKMCW